MAGFAYTGQITDPNAKKAIINALDLIAALRQQVTALQAAALVNSATIDAGGQRLADLGAPSAGTDAATVDYVRAYVAAQLEGFKRGATGTIDTTTAQIVTVTNGLITEIT